jgi:hypothetical protein
MPSTGSSTRPAVKIDFGSLVWSVVGNTIIFCSRYRGTIPVARLLIGRLKTNARSAPWSALKNCRTSYEQTQRIRHHYFLDGKIFHELVSTCIDRSAPKGQLGSIMGGSEPASAEAKKVRFFSLDAIVTCLHDPWVNQQPHDRNKQVVLYKYLFKLNNLLRITHYDTLIALSIKVGGLTLDLPRLLETEPLASS